MPIMLRNPKTGKAFTLEKKEVYSRLTLREQKFIHFIRNQKIDVDELINKLKE